MADKFTGAKSQFTVGSTDYLCLDSFEMSQNIQVAVALCSGTAGATVVKVPATGGVDSSFTFNMLAEDDYYTELNALVPGTTGAFEAHPAGDVAGKIEFTAASCLVRSLGLSVQVAGVAVIPVTIDINGTLTIQAAS